MRLPVEGSPVAEPVAFGHCQPAEAGGFGSKPGQLPSLGKALGSSKLCNRVSQQVIKPSTSSERVRGSNALQALLDVYSASLVSRSSSSRPQQERDGLEEGSKGSSDTASLPHI